MKGKYNTGKPISINELSKKERKLAFHEWAEGSKALEKLLNEGYKKGFLSHACCGGDTGHPYICYDLNDERSRKIAMHIAQHLIKSELDCEIVIYDNFELNEIDPKQYPTKDITYLNVLARLENKEEVFKTMSNSIKKVKFNKIKLPETQDEIPRKEFEKVDEIENKQNVDSALEQSKEDNEFGEELKQETYALEEVSQKDFATTENSAMDQPLIQASVEQDQGIVK